ncbi:MAG TPA: TetR/AcrR family transcriptional regulator [Acidimicrobiia bacterium]|nr:TetR/AcrR family transcriptional regulator [Acidimicrobiia bacterium]
MGSLSVRERVLEGGLVSIGRYGLARTTVDDVAQASGVSRATIYRHFPGGRDQIVRDTVAWEMGRFFTSLGEAVAAAPDLCVLLEDALVFARKALGRHMVFQRVVQTEPERLLPLLTVESFRILPLIAGFLVPYLDRERRAGRLREGADIDRTADYIARMVLSCIGATGVYDLDDPAEVRLLVREQLLAGVLARGAIVSPHP